MQNRIWILCAVLLMFAVSLLGGCKQQSATNPTTTSSAVKTYHLRGKIVSIDAASGVVTVDHEAIPGFMDAMTMPYKLKDANVAKQLHSGDSITATVLVGKDDEDALLDEVVVTAQAIGDNKPTAK